MDRTQRDAAILAAGREGLRRRLIAEKRLPEPAAESWLAAWEAEAERRAVGRGPDYWRHGSRWILAHLPVPNRPPSPHT